MIIKTDRIVYITTDGTVFFNEQYAKDHELQHQLADLITKDSGHWADQGLFLNFLMDNKTQLVKIFKKYDEDQSEK